MFTTLIVQPLFNLLVLIYALIPGHNFGIALIIFTIIIRMLMWPLVKRQLHQAKAMRKLQPELKKIKAATKGNRAKEQQMVMELYKERGINPFGAFPTLIVQFIILIGLYSGLHKIIVDPHSIVTFTYPFVRHIAWIQTISGDIHQFDNTLFGIVDLSRSALKAGGGIYWPAMVIVFASAVAQYFQAKQLMPTDKDARGLRTILKESSKGGKQADQAEINAAVGRSTRYLLPVMIFFFTVSIPSALSLYWLTGGIVAYIQQAYILRQDETELEAIADKPTKDAKSIPEAEIVSQPKPKPTKATSKKSKKRRK